MSRYQRQEGAVSSSPAGAERVQHFLQVELPGSAQKSSSRRAVAIPAAAYWCREHGTSLEPLGLGRLRAVARGGGQP